jgi:hypothetical protein
MNAPPETARPLRIVQVCADRGIAPGATKGAPSTCAASPRISWPSATRSSPSPAGAPRVRSPFRGAAAGSPRRVRRRRRRRLRTIIARPHRRPRRRRRHGAAFVLEVNAPWSTRPCGTVPTPSTTGHAGAEARLLAEADLVVVVSDALAHWASRPPHRSRRRRAQRLRARLVRRGRTPGRDRDPGVPGSPEAVARRRPATPPAGRSRRPRSPPSPPRDRWWQRRRRPPGCRHPERRRRPCRGHRRPGAGPRRAP